MRLNSIVSHFCGASVGLSAGIATGRGTYIAGTYLAGQGAGDVATVAGLGLAVLFGFAAYRASAIGFETVLFDKKPPAPPSPKPPR